MGALVTLLVIISYFIGVYFENDGVIEVMNSAHGTTMAFLTMSMAEIFHSFNMCSQRGSIFGLKSQNKTLWIAAVGSLVATTLVCEVPFLANAFGFAAVGIQEYLIAIGIGFVVIPVVELVKLIQRKISKDN